MNVTTDQLEALTAIRTDLGAIFVSLELSTPRIERHQNDGVSI